MKEATLNCENMPCPKPVVLTRKLLDADDPASLNVTVDNEAALENVSRLLASRGYATSHTAKDGLFVIKAEKTARPGNAPATGPEAHAAKDAENSRILVLILSPFVGSGDDTLGAKLMKNLLGTLPEMGEALWRVILLNGGVTLAAEGSPVIEELRALENAGTGVLVCGACLEHYSLMSKKAVGQTTNMLDVVTSMELADKVIRI